MLYMSDSSLKNLRLLGFISRLAIPTSHMDFSLFLPMNTSSMLGRRRSRRRASPEIEVGGGGGGGGRESSSIDACLHHRHQSLLLPPPPPPPKSTHPQMETHHPWSSGGGNPRLMSRSAGDLSRIFVVNIPVQVWDIKFWVCCCCR